MGSLVALTSSLIALVGASLVMAQNRGVAKNPPEFLAELPNITVAMGRDAVIPCVVDNLQDYKVAFIHLDRQMILTIHTHIITRIPRFEITRDNFRTWNLHIKKVQKEDRGHYMCQINTDPMISKIGILNVVVPPNIVDQESSPSVVSIREEHNASLICKADGTPQPRIKWRREDGKPIIIKRTKTEAKRELQVFHGDVLDLIRVSRTEMGAYLCIASNDVPPAVSKRIILTVEFSPMIWISEQLKGAPLGITVRLLCSIESSPKAISYWSFKDQMVPNSDRITASEKHHSDYKLDSVLTIRNVQKEDFGTYECTSGNSLGTMKGTIMLYELEPEPEEVDEMVQVPELTSFEELDTIPSHDVIMGNDIDGFGGQQPQPEHQDMFDANKFEEDTRAHDKRQKQKRRRDKAEKKATYWYQESGASTTAVTSLILSFLSFSVCLFEVWSKLLLWA